jgi:hypothetical protein
MNRKLSKIKSYNRSICLVWIHLKSKWSDWTDLTVFILCQSGLIGQFILYLLHVKVWVCITGNFIISFHNLLNLQNKQHFVREIISNIKTGLENTNFNFGCWLTLDPWSYMYTSMKPNELQQICWYTSDRNFPKGVQWKKLHTT